MESEGIGLMDLAAAGREYPQFGRSVWNTGRSSSQVFGGSGQGCGCGGGCGGDPGDCSCANGDSTERAGKGGACCNCEEERCPQYCLDAHALIVSGQRDTRIGNIKAWRFYAMFCENIPECPPHPEYGPPAPLPKTCGPDVTDYVVDQLDDIIKKGPLAAGFTVNRGSPIDFKDYIDGKGRVPGCPRDCPYSVGLCGHCVTSQLPGNIGLGSILGDVLGFPVAEWLGEGYQRINNWIDPDIEPEHDSSDDIEAYTIGELFWASAYGMPRAHFQGPTSKEQRKSILCVFVGKSVKGGRTPVKEGCVPCSKSWPS